MYIETKEIGPEGLVIERVIKGISLTLQDETVRIGDVHLTAEAQREAEGIAFAGEIAAETTLHCSRCLEAYVLPLQLHFDLLFTPDPEPAEGGEHRVDEESITRAPLEGGRIDLNAVVTEQVDLGLPLKPLCRTDCAGLCPRCGTNRNQGTCGCREERDDDPRLRVLKDLV
jgi:uncharacterized protein